LCFVAQCDRARLIGPGLGVPLLHIRPLCVGRSALRVIVIIDKKHPIPAAVLATLAVVSVAPTPAPVSKNPYTDSYPAARFDTRAPQTKLHGVGGFHCLLAGSNAQCFVNSAEIVMRVVKADRGGVRH